MTEPALVQRWLGHGMPGWTMPVCDIDLKVGGTYRYLWRKADGVEMGMRGVFQEITRPERLVATEKFDEAWYPGEALDTSVLVERDGKTTLTLTVKYDSRETRDAVVETGAIDGMSGSYDQLEALLAQLGREA